MPAVALAASPGSQVGTGQALKASKREAPSKIRFPAEMRRLLEDDQVDRPGV